MNDRFEAIQKRAFEISEFRKWFKETYHYEIEGDQLSDWLQAEKEYDEARVYK